MNIERGVRFHYGGDTRRLFAHRRDATPGGGASGEESETSRQWNTIVSLLRDRRTHDRFRAGDPQVVGAVFHRLDKKTSSEATALTQAIISGLARGNGEGPGQFKDTNERRTALTILNRLTQTELIEHKLDPERIHASYSDALHTEDVATDPLRAWTLVEAGKIVAPYMPGTAEVWRDTRESLEQIASSMKYRPTWLKKGEVTKRIPLKYDERQEVIRTLMDDPTVSKGEIADMVSKPPPKETGSPQEPLPPEIDKYPGINQESKLRYHQVAEMTRKGVRRTDITRQTGISENEISKMRSRMLAAGISLEPKGADEAKGDTSESGKENAKGDQSGKESGQPKREDEAPDKGDDPGMDDPGDSEAGSSRTPRGPEGDNGPASGGKALEPGHEENIGGKEGKREGTGGQQEPGYRTGQDREPEGHAEQDEPSAGTQAAPTGNARGGAVELEAGHEVRPGESGPDRPEEVPTHIRDFVKGKLEAGEMERLLQIREDRAGAQEQRREEQVKAEDLRPEHHRTDGQASAPRRDEAHRPAPEQRGTEKKGHRRDGAEQVTPAKSQQERIGAAMTDGGKLNADAGKAVTDGELNRKAGEEMIGGKATREPEHGSQRREPAESGPPRPPSHRSREAGHAHKGTGSMASKAHVEQTKAPGTDHTSDKTGKEARRVGTPDIAK